MELSHFRCFLAVAREGGFARAARRMAVDPSTLYRRLNDLELELGVGLFDRGDGDVRLSGAGLLFLDHASRIVDEAKRIAEDMASLAKGRRGVVRIGLNGIAAELPAVSRALIGVHDALRDLEIRLSVMPSERQLAQVRSGALDVGIVYGRAATDSDIGFMPVQRQRFVLAVARDHALAKRELTRLIDLSGEAFIFQSRASAGAVHDRLLSACSAAGLVPDIQHYIVDEDTQLAMVAAGMGITLTLEGAALRRWREQVVFRPVEGLDVSVDLDLVWLAATESPSVRRVVEAVRTSTSEPLG